MKNPLSIALKTAKDHTGYTYTWIGKKTGITGQYAATLSHGQRQGSAETWGKIAHLFGFTYAQFYKLGEKIMDGATYEEAKIMVNDDEKINLLRTVDEDLYQLHVSRKDCNVLDMLIRFLAEDLKKGHDSETIMKKVINVLNTYINPPPDRNG